jgi:hypothetical protein
MSEQQEPTAQFRIHPCTAARKSGNYSVAKPGDFPVFIDGAYYWPKERAEEIAKKLNTLELICISGEPCHTRQDCHCNNCKTYVS